MTTQVKRKFKQSKEYKEIIEMLEPHMNQEAVFKSYVDWILDYELDLGAIVFKIAVCYDMPNVIDKMSIDWLINDVDDNVRYMDVRLCTKTLDKNREATYNTEKRIEFKGLEDEQQIYVKQ